MRKKGEDSPECDIIQGQEDLQFRDALFPFHSPLLRESQPFFLRYDAFGSILFLVTKIIPVIPAIFLLLRVTNFIPLMDKKNEEINQNCRKIKYTNLVNMVDICPF
jgi:hypothetical protein